jgi:uncharacterized protein
MARQAPPDNRRHRAFKETPLPGSDRNPFVVVRPSSIHGLGVFALRRIARNTRIIEYVGEVLSTAELNARYDSNARDPRGHTYVFHLDGDRYIDAARAGNDSRFINHSCDPNCEAFQERGRIYIRALQNIELGSELTYDYYLELEDEPLPSWKLLYTCRCGGARCRGTMLKKSNVETSSRRSRRVSPTMPIEQARNPPKPKLKTSRSHRRLDEPVLAADNERGRQPKS